MDAEEHAEIWRGLRFDAPLFGLSSAPRRARSCSPCAPSCARIDELTMNRVYFHAALGEDGEEAAGYWRACLECGDMMAHYGLGYTALRARGLPAPHGAYRHLRRYTELVPTNAWAWCWFGKACAALGALKLARRTPRLSGRWSSRRPAAMRRTRRTSSTNCSRPGRSVARTARGGVSNYNELYDCAQKLGQVELVVDRRDEHRAESRSWARPACDRGRARHARATGGGVDRVGRSGDSKRASRASTGQPNARPAEAATSSRHGVTG